MTSDSAGDAERLARAVKTDDSTFTTFLVSPYSRFIARSAARHGIAPTTVTVISLLLGLTAAAAFAVGGRVALIGGAVLLQLAFVADCVDGQLARYAGRSSEFGGWLDAMGDRVKEYAVYGGLALGSIRGFGDPIWVLAMAAVALQTVRHTVDFGYGIARRATGASGAVAPPQTRPVSHWVKRSLVLPIGERFALISLLAAVSTPRVTLTVVLVWGGLAAGYSVAGKLRRTVVAWTP